MENIQIYYESIKQVYEQIKEWRENQEKTQKPLLKKITEKLVIGFLVVFVLNVIPIIPFLFTFIGEKLSWEFWSISLKHPTIGTYLFSWPIGIFIAIPLMALATFLDEKASDLYRKRMGKAPQTISADQISFIYAYQAYKELKIYFISHFDQHIEKALDALKMLSRPPKGYDEFLSRDAVHIRYEGGEEYDRPIYAFFEPVALFSSLFNQRRVARQFLQTFEKYPWFHIDSVIKSRLQSLITFSDKIESRLKKREDLPAVLTILENLSKFLFAFLPEHQTNMNTEDLSTLQTEGLVCLDKFADDVNRLLELPMEKEKEEKKIVKRPNLLKHQLSYFGAVLFRFAVWLVIMLITTSALVYLASLYFSKIDINVMISVVIPTSFGGAGVLAAIGLKNIRDDQETVNKKLDMERTSASIEASGDIK